MSTSHFVEAVHSGHVRSPINVVPGDGFSGFLGAQCPDTVTQVGQGGPGADQGEMVESTLESRQRSQIVIMIALLHRSFLHRSFLELLPKKVLDLHTLPTLDALHIPQVLGLGSTVPSLRALHQAQTHRRIPCSGLLGVLDITPHQAAKVQADLTEHVAMLLGLRQAPRPDLTALLDTAQLAGQGGVEGIHLLLGPFDAGAHHRVRKACLEAADSVADQGEVNKRNLPNVEVQITLEDALPVFMLAVSTFSWDQNTHRKRFLIVSVRASR